MSPLGISDGGNELDFHVPVGLSEESSAALAAHASPDVRLAAGMELVVMVVVGMGMGGFSPSSAHVCP